MPLGSGSQNEGEDLFVFRGAPFNGPRSHCSPYSVSTIPSPQQGFLPASSLPAEASGGSGIPPSDQVPAQIPAYGLAVALHKMNWEHSLFV